MPAIDERPSRLQSQNLRNGTDRCSTQRLEKLAALLTEAVYPIALQRDGKSWVDLELAVWNVISETLNGPAVAQIRASKGE
jgi:hypothetical protein